MVEIGAKEVLAGLRGERAAEAVREDDSGERMEAAVLTEAQEARAEAAATQVACPDTRRAPPC